MYSPLALHYIIYIRLYSILYKISMYMRMHACVRMHVCTCFFLHTERLAQTLRRLRW